MIGCGLILALAIGWLWIARAPVPMATATVVMGLAAGAIYPTGLAIIGDRVPAGRLGSGNSLYTMAYSAGSIVGPVSAGMAIDRYGAAVMVPALGAVAIVFVTLTAFEAHLRGRQGDVVARQEDAAV